MTSTVLQHWSAAPGAGLQTQRVRLISRGAAGAVGAPGGCSSPFGAPGGCTAAGSFGCLEAVQGARALLHEAESAASAHPRSAALQQSRAAALGALLASMRHAAMIALRLQPPTPGASGTADGLLRVLPALLLCGVAHAPVDAALQEQAIGRSLRALLAAEEMRQLARVLGGAASGQRDAAAGPAERRRRAEALEAQANDMQPTLLSTHDANSALLAAAGRDVMLAWDVAILRMLVDRDVYAWRRLAPAPTRASVERAIAVLRGKKRDAAAQYLDAALRLHWPAASA